MNLFFLLNFGFLSLWQLGTLNPSQIFDITKVKIFKTGSNFGLHPRIWQPFFTLFACKSTEKKIYPGRISLRYCLMPKISLSKSLLGESQLLFRSLPQIFVLELPTTTPSGFTIGNMRKMNKFLNKTAIKSSDIRNSSRPSTTNDVGDS